jgi:hypothetical protein
MGAAFVVVPASMKCHTTGIDDMVMLLHDNVGSAIVEGIRWLGAGV